MALRSAKEARTGRRVGIAWMLLCIIGATAVALIGTAFFGQDPSIAVTDRDAFETIFLDMGRILFHPLIAGLILTAVLAAIMSTMSSQLLVTSSALIEDLFKIFKKDLSNQMLINLSRMAVVAVAVVAAALAFNPNDSILGLVGFAWAGFGSAFGQVVIASLYWSRLNAPGAIAGMITGAVVSFAWGMTPALHAALYEIVPGVVSATIVMVVVSLLTKAPTEDVVEEFEQATAAAAA